ncbi:MAG: response regulator transcription factor [Candidatus Methanofastidiosia archaeon]
MSKDNKEQKTIIYAEDDQDIARLVKFKLEREGFKVIHFSDGEGVTEAILEMTPDLVLLDVMMPVRDGISILKNIKANPKTASIPTIMLSAKGQEGDIVKGLEVGATDYLTKPFAPSELVARVNKVI